MLYQLQDGRTIELSIEDYLSFSDQELHQLIGNAYYGDFVNNPAYGSSIIRPGKPEPNPSETKKLYNISEETKLTDKDFRNEE